jgi:hypothetical protein
MPISAPLDNLRRLFVQTALPIAGSGHGYYGVVGRRVDYSTNDSDGYFAITETGTNLLLYKRVSGTWAFISSATITETAGDVIKLQMIGSAIKVFYNGTEKISVTDTSLTAAGDAGLTVAQTGYAGDLFDNFSVVEATSTATLTLTAQDQVGTVRPGVVVFVDGGVVTPPVTQTSAEVTLGSHTVTYNDADTCYTYLNTSPSQPMNVSGNRL